MKRLAGIVLLAAAVAGCSKETVVEVKAPEMSAAVREAIRLIGVLEGTSSDVGVTQAVVNVRGLTALQFRKRLLAFPGEEVHVWMPGERDWVLVGNETTNGVSLAAAMERFAADTNCTASVPEVFASYVGTRDEVMPAFRGLLEGEVVPQWFVTREVPSLAWLRTDGIDADILAPTLAEVRSVQVVRRLVLEGNMQAAQAKDKKGEEAATDTWAKAALRNPNDPMLLERIDRLNRNAKGFLEVGKVLQAMKCYETLVLIRPNDATAVRNFGLCLKKIGKLDMSEKVLKRAEILLKSSRE